MASGILYDRRKRRKHGEVDIGAIVRKLKAIAYSMRWAGMTLMCLAGVGFVWIFTPLIVVELQYKFNPPQVVQETGPSKFGVEVEEWPTWEVPDKSYSLFIPKIGARARIIKDVDAASEKEYLAALKLGIAAARGLAYPGQKGTTYLFAHSTNSPLNFARYNAIFYLLDKMGPKDTIEVVYEDKLYKYAVSDIRILAADNTDYLVPQQDEERLVLQTCYPPGTTWKRLVIVAKRS